MHVKHCIIHLMYRIRLCFKLILHCINHQLIWLIRETSGPYLFFCFTSWRSKWIVVASRFKSKHNLIRCFFSRVLSRPPLCIRTVPTKDCELRFYGPGKPFESCDSFELIESFLFLKMIRYSIQQRLPGLSLSFSKVPWRSQLFIYPHSVGDFLLTVFVRWAVQICMLVHYPIINSNFCTTFRHTSLNHWYCMEGIPVWFHWQSKVVCFFIPFKFHFKILDLKNKQTKNLVWSRIKASERIKWFLSCFSTLHYEGKSP